MCSVVNWMGWDVSLARWADDGRRSLIFLNMNFVEIIPGYELRCLEMYFVHIFPSFLGGRKRRPRGRVTRFIGRGWHPIFPPFSPNLKYELCWKNSQLPIHIKWMRLRWFHQAERWLENDDMIRGELDLINPINGNVGFKTTSTINKKIEFLKQELCWKNSHLLLK